MSQKIHVEKSCCANSYDMKPDKDGRYCNSCQKVAVDFSGKTMDEIQDYLATYKGSQICGNYQEGYTTVSNHRGSFKRKRLYYIAALILAGLVLNSCSTYESNPTQVVLWQLGDPEMLNPILADDLGSAQIDNNIFQPLLNFDYRTFKLVPVLADSLPTLKVDSAGRMYITYEIRKEAKWDNGSPVTAKDAEFTLKVIMNPAVNDEALRSYYDMVSDIILYPDNPRKFTVVYNEKYMMAIIATGTYTYIIPEYAYDSSKYMESFTMKQMYHRYSYGA